MTATDDNLLVGLVALAALCSACASRPAEKGYQSPPAGSPAAVIVSAGMGGRAAMIDGKETPSFSGTTRVSPGIHKVLIDCLFMGVDVVHTKIEYVALTGAFVASEKYYVRCTVEDSKPHVFLAASPNGAPLPGFE